MNKKYYSGDRESYFEEPKTTAGSDRAATVKTVVDSFNEKIVDSRYSVHRPTARIVGYVKKQD